MENIRIYYSTLFLVSILLLSFLGCMHKDLEELNKKLEYLAIKTEHQASQVQQQHDTTIKQMTKVEKDLTSKVNSVEETQTQQLQILDSVRQDAYKEEPKEIIIQLVPTPTPVRVSGIKQDEQLLLSGYEDFVQGNASTAMDKFFFLIKQYPNSLLVDDSYYWLAEYKFSEGKYQDAIQYYGKALSSYKQEEVNEEKELESPPYIKNLPPAAMLGSALCYLELFASGSDVKGKQTAKRLLQQIIEKYPKTPEAKAAQARLEGL